MKWWWWWWMKKWFILYAMWLLPLFGTLTRARITLSSPSFGLLSLFGVAGVSFASVIVGRLAFKPTVAHHIWWCWEAQKNWSQYLRFVGSRFGLIVGVGQRVLLLLLPSHFSILLPCFIFHYCMFDGDNDDYTIDISRTTTKIGRW